MSFHRGKVQIVRGVGNEQGMACSLRHPAAHYLVIHAQTRRVADFVAVAKQFSALARPAGVERKEVEIPMRAK